MEIARSLVEVEGLTQTFPGTHGKESVSALSDVSFAVREGELVSLLGPSGCGKSTILNLVAGFLAPTSGKVIVGGEAVKGASPSRAVVFQEPALFPWLSVLDNVLFGPLAQGKPRADVERRACELLDRVGLGAFRQHFPHQLSGGMKQRVAIARVLINDPAILLMDEPFGALDAQTRLEMQDYLMQLRSDFRSTVIFVTHDVDEAVFISERILIMSKRPGRIVREIEVAEPRPRGHAFLTSEHFNACKRVALDMLWEQSASTTPRPAPERA